jgi:hypothetical protein
MIQSLWDGQVADDEAASGASEYSLSGSTNVAQAFGHDAAGGGRNTNANHCV